MDTESPHAVAVPGPPLRSSRAAVLTGSGTDRPPAPFQSARRVAAASVTRGVDAQSDVYQKAETMPTSVAPNRTPGPLLHGRAGPPGSTPPAQLCSASISEPLNSQQKSRNLVEPPATRSAERPIRNLIERRAATSPATGRKRDSSHRASVSRTTETSVETAGGPDGRTASVLLLEPGHSIPECISQRMSPIRGSTRRQSGGRLYTPAGGVPEFEER